MLWTGTILRWWRDRRRRIFRYEVNGETRWADPMRLCAAVEDLCPNLDDLIAVVRSETPALPGSLAGGVRSEKLAAAKELVRVARLLFGLPEFAGEGLPPGVTRSRGHLSDTEAMALFRSFLDWLSEAGDAARP